MNFYVINIIFIIIFTFFLVEKSNDWNPFRCYKQIYRILFVIAIDIILTEQHQVN